MPRDACGTAPPRTMKWDTSSHPIWNNEFGSNRKRTGWLILRVFCEGWTYSRKGKTLPFRVYRFRRALCRTTKKFHQPFPRGPFRGTLEDFGCRFHDALFFCYGYRNPLVQGHAVFLGKPLSGFLGGEREL